jgi:hypothetical protein
MAEPSWAEAHRNVIARSAGVIAIVFVVLQFLPGSNLGGPFFDDSVTTPELLGWVKAHTDQLLVEGFLGALSLSLNALFLLALVTVSRGRDLTARIATMSVAAMLAVDWVHAGVYFALGDAGTRESADAGIVALFSLTKTMTFADGVPFGLAVIAVCVAALRSRTLPVPLCGLGLAVGTWHLVSVPVQFAINGQTNGITGPISALSGLCWVLAVGVVLVLRPVRGGTPTPVGASA